MNTLYRRKQFLYALVASFGLLFVLTSTTLAAPAHAKVIDSNPKANTTIPDPPTTISVTTAENMKPGAANSNLFVYGPNGDLISQGDATVDINNPMRMSVPIKPQGNGVYTIRWVTVSADDGDPDQGAFGFMVGATASTTASPAGHTNSTATTGTTGTPIWLSIILGVVALIIGLGAGFSLGRAGRAAIAPTTSTASTEEENEVSKRS